MAGAIKPLPDFGIFSLSSAKIDYQGDRKVILFWILDFGFLIGKPFVHKSSVSLSVAFFFQIGVIYQFRKRTLY
jgi:hypothetical protein